MSAAAALKVNIHRSVHLPGIPPQAALRRWARAAYLKTVAAGISLSVVDESQSAALNTKYRQKAYATNVLSFPMELPAGIGSPPLLGDIVLCAPVIAREATELGKNHNAHWAHMVVHGMLHLQGYDHIETTKALEMEALEVEILTILGYPNPYAEAS